MELPRQFIELIESHPQTAILKDSLLTQPSVSVRINNAKLGSKDSLNCPLTNERVEWCPDGYYLEKRQRFTFDPALHQGLYYVQDASSMALSAIVSELSAGKNIRYLDACAAPGGKTIGVMSALSSGSVIVANEYDFKRAAVLCENVAKWGIRPVVVSRGDTSRFRKLKDAFDIVAVDAPCSGEGMMRKESKAIEQWSPALVNQCSLLQKEILSNIWPSLRPGGYLIFSTCTFNTVENEDNVKWLIDEFDACPIEIQSLQNINGICGALTNDAPCYRFLPGKIKGEGLFVCVLRKPGDFKERHEKQPRPSKLSPQTAMCSKWLKQDLEIISVGNELYAIDSRHANFISGLYKTLDILSPGIHVATIKGRDIIPAHELALSTAFNDDSFPDVELSLADALRYLRCESLDLPDSAPKGFVLVKHGGVPLGFVKNIGNRCNNLYPRNWRIVSQNM